MSGTAPQVLSKFLQRAKVNKGFDKCLEKVKLVAAGNGAVKAELKLDEDHTNIYGGLHGGFSATLVDVISTWSLLTHKYGGNDSVSVDINVTYVKGAKIGDEITIDARTLKTGKNLAFLEVEIKNKVTGDLLVKGSHTKFFMPNRSS